MGVIMRSFYSGRGFTCLSAPRTFSECSDLPARANCILAAVAAGTIGALRASALSTIATAEYASLLQRSTHFEARQTADSASLS